MLPPETFVLDSSALLALRGEETGADQVESLLRKAKEGVATVLASFMTRMEVLYLIWRHEGEAAAQQALRLIDSFELEWVSCEDKILETASRLKSRGHLSVADCWIAATAIVRQATLVHCDPEFRSVSELPQLFLGE